MHVQVSSSTVMDSVSLLTLVHHTVRHLHWYPESGTRVTSHDLLFVYDTSSLAHALQMICSGDRGFKKELFDYRRY